MSVLEKRRRILRRSEADQEGIILVLVGVWVLLAMAVLGAV